MRYTAAYLLAVLGGNSSPDVAAIAKILGSVGIECDENRAQKVIDACKGQDVNEIIAKGMTKVDDALANTSAGTVGTTHNDMHAPVKTEKPPVEPSPSSSPAGSRPGSPAFVSSCFHLIVFIFINMFLFIFNRETCLVNTNASNLGKNQSKQELLIIILSFFFCCIVTRIKYGLILSNMKY
jgi:large subunit ribosomal protein LP2